MQKDKTVGIFTPFPPQIGGGEHYIFALAEVFSVLHFQVTILSPFVYDISSFASNFHLNLSYVSYTQTSTKDFFIPPFHSSFDYFFCLSNHIVPPVFGQGRSNTLILQFPFPHPIKKIGDFLQSTTLSLPKLGSYQQIICYSAFSKKWIARRLPPRMNEKPIHIIAPSIDTNLYTHDRVRKNIILTVGRFFSGDHNKHHRTLISAFESLIHRPEAKNWEYHIAGSLSNDEAATDYFHNIQRMITSDSIVLHPNLPSEELLALYSSSKLYWHGTGFENDEEISPEKSEHFGITIIEAMAAGLVPLVINSGALSEIISDGTNGFLVSTLQELTDKTLLLLGNASLLDALSIRCTHSAQMYSRKKFREKIYGLFDLS